MKTNWKNFRTITGLALALAGTNALAAETVWLADLDLSKMEQDWQHARANKSVDGKTLSIGGQKFERGVGTHATSLFYLKLDGQGRQFTAKVGVDDEVGQGKGSVTFKLVGDAKTQLPRMKELGFDEPILIR